MSGQARRSFTAILVLSLGFLSGGVASRAYALAPPSTKGGSAEDASLRDTLVAALGIQSTLPKIAVQNGVVTLSGNVYGAEEAETLLHVVQNTPGVKAVVNRMQMIPRSPVDDALRVALTDEICGREPLKKYATDSARSIQIFVEDGQVTLLGTVDSKADKDIAEARANEVPGVFKLTDEIQVAAPSAK